MPAGPTQRCAEAQEVQGIMLRVGLNLCHECRSHAGRPHHKHTKVIITAEGGGRELGGNGCVQGVACGGGFTDVY